MCGGVDFVGMALVAIRNHNARILCTHHRALKGQSITNKSERGVLSLYNYICLPYHALKHMAIDRPSLLKQAAPLRLVAGCGTQTALAGLAGQ